MANKQTVCTYWYGANFLLRSSEYRGHLEDMGINLESMAWPNTLQALEDAVHAVTFKFGDEGREEAELAVLALKDAKDSRLRTDDTIQGHIDWAAAMLDKIGDKLNPRL